MIVKVFEDNLSLGAAAAEHAATVLRRAIREKGHARMIVATGTSQLNFLDALTTTKNIDWKKIEMFHLDEYVGLPITHPASFCKYLLDRLISKTGITQYHFLDGTAELEEVVRRVGGLLQSAPIDIAFAGIGENGHLAFNDPPADFQTDAPYLIVNLDEPCRRQQVGEGWFAELSEVPAQAISMSVRQILKSKEIISVVPDVRKAAAAKRCLEDGISPMAPASILGTHPATTIYLDRDSASLLSPATLVALAATG